MPLEPGTRLGPYDLQSRLGGGGMGEVWKAYDPKLQRTVGIKILYETEDAASRILAEARAASALNHPHICTIHDVGEADGQSFIVMEHVEGRPLSELIPSDGLPAESVIRYGTQIADALAHAHEHGIVNRDLKSANVVITPDGRAKVLDFGVADKLPAADAEAVTKTQAAPAQSGLLVGTLAYMAPEQLRGEKATPRSDVWSLGVLLYEMASGRLPFEGVTGAEIAANILRESPASLPDRMSANLQSIVERCLSKEAGRRYSGGDALHSALEAIQSVAASASGSPSPSAEDGWPVAPAPAPSPRESGESSSGVLESPPRRRGVGGWSWMASVGVAALVVVGLLSYWSVTREAPSTPGESSFRPMNQFLATVPPGSHGAATLSPDGSTMAFVSDASGMPRIWVQTITEGAAPIPITGEDAPALSPSWSPTNGQIAFHRPGDGIWTVGPLGTPAPRRIIDEGINPSFSWDGSRIVYERFPQIWIANADGTDQRAVEGADLLMPTAVMNVVNGFPALSPDGESIVYFRMASGPLGDFWIIPAAGGEPRRLTFDTNQGSHPVWTPDGRHVIVSSLRSGSWTLWRIAAEGGEPEPVTSGAGEDSEPAISRDGRRLVYSNVRNVRAMMIYEPQVGESPEILSRRYGLIHPRFSPDGESIVFFGEVAGGTEIFVVGADGQGLRELTRGDGQFNIHPQWAADGSAVFFYRDYPYREDSPGDFLRVSVDGGPVEMVLPGFYWDRQMAADVHPDGNSLAYHLVEPPPAGSTTVVRDIESGQERILPVVLTLPRWSHDGVYLAGSDLSGAGVSERLIWVCSIDDGCESVAEGFWPAWSADDTELYFYRSATARAPFEVWVIDRDGRNLRQVVEVGQIHPVTPFFDVAPDGRIVWTQYRPGNSEVWSADIE